MRVRFIKEPANPTSADRPLKKIFLKSFESGLEYRMTISMPEMAKKHDVV